MNKDFIKIFFLISIHLNTVTSEIRDYKNYKRINCKLVPVLRLRSGKRTHPHIPVNHKVADGIASNNWCGYICSRNIYNVSSAINTVSFVQGTWTVPKIRHSPEPTYCATWVGIDGFNNNTVEMIGTEQEYLGTSGQVNYAWIQMYPHAPLMISNFPVHPHDSITGLIQFNTNKKIFEFTLINETKKVMYSRNMRSVHRKNGPQKAVAQWIVEAPYSDGVLPLANFGTIEFSNCLAKIRGTMGAIDDLNWMSSPLIMESKAGQRKAEPSGLDLDGTGFSVTWQRN